MASKPRGRKLLRNTSSEDVSHSAPVSHLSIPIELVASATVECRPKIDNARCIFKSCLHGEQRRSIATDQRGVRVTVPFKRIKKVGKAKREQLVIEWKEEEDACFHQDCWEQITSFACSKRKRSKTPPLLSDLDASLVEDIVDTAEVYEPLLSIKDKAKKIADLMLASRHTTVFTGAGISVAAGIPTYRGVDGIDVLAEFGGPNEPAIVQPSAGNSGSNSKAEPKGKKKAKKTDEDLYIESSDEYLKLQPTLAHLLISKWMNTDRLVQFVITQNCDDLHHRSGVPRAGMVELHGNVFIEYCEACGLEYRRPYCVDLFSTDCRKEPWYVECSTCRLNHYTGRHCTAKGCKGKLKDTIVNFGDDLHKEVLGGLDLAADKCQQSALVVCLGSSMTVTPASNLPTLMPDGAIVIVNPQTTKLDSKAAVRVWGCADQLLHFVDVELAARRTKAV